jgi:hypothetical protein
VCSFQLLELPKQQIVFSIGQRWPIKHVILVACLLELLPDRGGPSGQFVERAVYHGDDDDRNPVLCAVG